MAGEDSGRVFPGSQGPPWEPHFVQFQLSDRGFAHQLRPGKDAGASQSGFPRRTLGTRETRQAAFLMQRRSVGLDAIVELVSERMSGVYR